VGRIVRPHGLRGEVVVVLSTDRDERLSPGSRLHTDQGELVVQASRRHQHRWIVSFEGRAARDQADELRGLTLRAEPFDDPSELWVHELVGAEVVTAGGEALGRCTAVVANPAADLLELDDGGLVPIVFVVDHAPGRVTVDPPEGLLDL
jgi:16S rRNA processing protein RimM